MTPEQIDQIQRSFGKVALVKQDAAVQFYDRLFELDPSLKPLFRGDMGQQGEKLMATIAVAVRNLKSPAAIADSVRQLGARHRGYGVREKHYETVAAALLWTLEKNLGDEFTPELKAAWTAMYVMVADLMKDGAKKAA